MQLFEQKILAELLGKYAEMYGKRLTSGAIELYCEALSSYELCDIKAALATHMRDPKNGRYMPKPADILAHLPPSQCRHTVKTCMVRVNGGRCLEEAIVNLGGEGKVFLICERHYELQRPKADWERQIDNRVIPIHKTFYSTSDKTSSETKTAGALLSDIVKNNVG